VAAAFTTIVLTGFGQLRSLTAMNALSRFSDPVYCILRLISGLMLATHGAQKVFGMFGGKVAAAPQMVFAGWVELVGGLFIAFGLLTRPMAFLCSGLMAAAYFMAHASGGWHPVVNKGELAVVYCFLFLYMFFYGPGRFSLDALVFNKRANTAR
jgi:putative oxidoreductase